MLEDTALQGRYRECSHREISDLRAAIRSDKFWKALPQGKGIYVVALTRARIPTAQGFQARVTHFGRLVIHPFAAPRCRKGMVVLVIRRSGGFVGTSVIRWSAFRRLMRIEGNLLERLVRFDSFPRYIGLQEVKELIRASYLCHRFPARRQFRDAERIR